MGQPVGSTHPRNPVPWARTRLRHVVGRVTVVTVTILITSLIAVLGAGCRSTTDIDPAGPAVIADDTALDTNATPATAVPATGAPDTGTREADAGPHAAPEPTARSEPTVAQPVDDAPTAAPGSGTDREQRFRFDDRFDVWRVSALSPTVVAAGDWNRVDIFLDVDAPPIETDPAGAESTALLSALVAFDGRLIAALGDDPDAPALLPRLVEWRPGQPDPTEWEPIATTVTRPAAATVLRRLTPPAPPFGGASGILDFATHRGRLYATGWASIDGETTNVMWSTGDGLDWALEPLPAVGEGVEYGGAIVVNESGIMINVANWTYFGAGVIARPHGGEWRTLPFPETRDGLGQSLLIDSEQGFWVHDVRFDQPDIVHASTDLAIWDRWEVPGDIPTDGGGFTNVTVESADPVALHSTHLAGAETTEHRWEPATQRWSPPTVFPGRYIDTVDGFRFVQTGEYLVVTPVP